MVQTLNARDLSLKQLAERFGIRESENELLFSALQEELPRITPEEQLHLERIRRNYRALSAAGPLSEDAVKMVVLGPLLDMAGFFEAPFQLQTEAQVEFASEDEGIIYRGKIDVLVLRERFWVLVIEAKNTAFDVLVGLPQALFYMHSALESGRPLFAWLINGRESIFVQLVQEEPGSRYGLSRAYSVLRPAEDLPALLAVLKHLGRIEI
ncbi:MAG: restriction endonuclease subunit R [Aphanocapsa lilacina HA4352-LM1]|jgi:hypothetical protein|nr:restriction endonuclease subunit R [Aphanocapsa lilacina HA4352-LM1]